MNLSCVVSKFNHINYHELWWVDTSATRNVGLSLNSELSSTYGFFSSGENGEAANQVFLPSTLPGSNFEESCAVPEKETNISDSASHINDGREAEPQPRTIGTLPVLPNAGTHELSSQDRDSAISRYKEKRQTRRYDKRIRYESRKVRAETRTRIKGRFAKLDR
ncbi:ZINC FINGER PROTEIN CONSTANS-LIKE 10 [Salix viminalis]|uniref:ZINC FINGER PROTEIN CONSTANS-LIKE 10 n=1 Tax=Salix viminalis TaxID=40686 RepID=A0A9Q0NS27_SALVM|nr:ZINC FINGER PROTEIN CONSTANS-LIKE 10 [Salix viminalis]